MDPIDPSLDPPLHSKQYDCRALACGWWPQHSINDKNLEAKLLTRNATAIKKGA